MNISHLVGYENDLFASIHNSFLSKRTNDFDSKAIYSNKNLQYTTRIELILIKTKKILDLFNKTNYDLSQYCIEFQQRNCGFEDECVQRHPTFTWHEDDYGIVNFNVYTIIYYIRKDKTIKGGNLEYIYENKNYMQQINERQILCFDGNLSHCPEMCTGIGCRDTIVVFIRRL